MFIIYSKKEELVITEIKPRQQSDGKKSFIDKISIHEFLKPNQFQNYIVPDREINIKAFIRGLLNLRIVIYSKKVLFVKAFASKKFIEWKTNVTVKLFHFSSWNFQNIKSLKKF